MEAAGAYDVSVIPLLRSGGWHLMGTAKMGTNPADSVVNRDGQAHDVKNLYVVDGSVFVTGGRRQPDLHHPGRGAAYRGRVQAERPEYEQLKQDKDTTMPKFLSQSQRSLATAVLDRLIPPRGDMPGAGEAGTADYLDGIASNSAQLCAAVIRGVAGHRDYGGAVRREFRGTEREAAGRSSERRGGGQP